MNWLKNSWQEAGAQLERQIGAAMALPLEEIFHATGYLVGFIGAFLGLLIGAAAGGAIGAMGGGFVGGAIGLVAGVIINILLFCLIYVIPAPFAWLASRLGYAR
jgi:predicted lipid-binding transport protein (Tim44 family)